MEDGRAYKTALPFRNGDNLTQVTLDPGQGWGNPSHVEEQRTLPIGLITCSSVAVPRLKDESQTQEDFLRACVLIAQRSSPLSISAGLRGYPGHCA
jgi:hypothetical protein